MSRRGYGASEQTVNGYGIDTLAGDILAVINALHIDKVILIGHSIAGDEITKFASSYPDRVDKVVYLDAAYDHTNVSTLLSHLPAFPNITAQDSSSLLNFKGFLERVMGVSMPDEELRNTIVFSSDGKYQKDVTPRSIEGLITNGIEHPDYKDMRCSALAIYAVPRSVNQLFPFYSKLTECIIFPYRNCRNFFKQDNPEYFELFASSPPAALCDYNEPAFAWFLSYSKDTLAD